MHCLLLGNVILFVILMPNFLTNFICRVSWILIVQLCYHQVLLGQVMHRLKLTWLGSESNHPDRSVMTFTILAIITAVHFCTNWVFYFTSLFLLILGALGESESEIDASQVLANLRSFLNLVFFVFLLVIMARTRRRIRSRYGIPERTCRGCEDCCCAFWCSCCTVSQMARHTADYDNYPAQCCSETGLSPNAPSIV
jgi:Cys-rich protein (TIGR01571 family)